MAGFCTKCGKPLQDGEVCTCTQQAAQQPGEGAGQQMNNQQAMNQQMSGQQPMNNQGAPMGQQMNYQQAAQPKNDAASKFFKELLETLKSIAVNPIKGGKAFTQKADIKIAMVFIGLQALLSGFFALIMCKKIADLTGIGAVTKSLSSLTGSSSKGTSMPYFTGFLGTVVLSLVFTFALIGVLFAANKILKNQVTFQQMMANVSIRSLVIVVFTVLAMIFCLFNIGWALGLFFLSDLVSVVVICMVAPFDTNTVDSKIVYAYAAAILVFTLVTTFIMSKCVGMYFPASLSSSITKAFSSLGSSSLSSLF